MLLQDGTAPLPNQDGPLDGLLSELQLSGEVIMIIWISGAYGVGKSTLASALVEKIDNSIVFDAEIVGNMELTQS